MNDTLGVFSRTHPEWGAITIGRGAFDPTEHAFHPWPSDPLEVEALEQAMREYAGVPKVADAPKPKRAKD